MPMKSIAEYFHAARHIELFILLLLLSALGLWLIGGAGGGTSAKTDAEARLERLLERVDGVRDVEVMISTDGEGKPMGVAVVAGGRVELSARLEMQSAIQALMDIDTSRIHIIGKGGTG